MNEVATGDDYVLAPPGETGRTGPERGKPVRDGIAKFVDPHGSYRYVLYEAGVAVAGIQIMSRDKHTGVIAMVYTVPSRRRQGLAAKLLAQARKDFKSVEHSEHLTDLGRAWKGGIGEVEEDYAAALRVGTDKVRIRVTPEQREYISKMRHAPLVAGVLFGEREQVADAVTFAMGLALKNRDLVVHRQLATVLRFIGSTFESREVRMGQVPVGVLMGEVDRVEVVDGLAALRERADETGWADLLEAPAKPKEAPGAKRARKLIGITQKEREKEAAALQRHRDNLAKIRQASDDAKRKALLTSESTNDRSEDETVVEYAVRQLFKRPTKTTVAAAAKATAKKLGGGDNLFLGNAVIIDPKKLEGAIWKRIAEFALKSNLDSAISKFGLYDGPGDFRGPKSMKHREAIRAAAKKLKGHDPFPPDVSEAVLTEGAMAIADLPPKVGIRVKQMDAKHLQVMYWVQSAKRRANAHDGAGGVIMLVRDERRYGQCDDAWMVEWSEAVKGWGPLLYDVCIEVTTKLGGGLMADRRSVSDDAHKVWMYYMSRRPDVKIHQLDDIEAPHLTGRPDDDCEQVSARDRADATKKRALQGDPDAKGWGWTDQPESKRITKDKPTTLRALLTAGKLMLDAVNAGKLGLWDKQPTA